MVEAIQPVVLEGDGNQLDAASSCNQEEESKEGANQALVVEQVTPEPIGPYLYGDKLSAELTTLQLASRGDEDALEEIQLSVEEAKVRMNKFKAISKSVETFRPSFPETTSSREGN